MERRLFIINAVASILTLSTASSLSAKENTVSNLKFRNDRLRIRKPTIKINYKGASFNVSKLQRSTFSSLTPSFKKKLNKPKNGKVLSVSQLEEFNNAVSVLERHGERQVASTVMCPW